MSRAKSPSKAAERHEEFVFWVRGPSLYYNFSLQHDRRVEGPYDEMQALHFVAECLYPDRCKGRMAEAGFHARENLAAGSELRRDRKEKPMAVGSIVVGKNKFDVGGFLAPDILWHLAAAMAAGTITSMTTGGRFPTPGHGYLNSVSFHGPDFDPVAYIG